MEIIKIAGICIICAILSSLISQTNKDILVTLSIAAVANCAHVIIGSVSDVISGLNSIFKVIGLDTAYLSVSFKALGICYVCELSSSSCRDCGESALASIIDISGKVAISLLCLPLLEKLMDVVRTILEM